jgi:hypothetical protein
VSNKIWPSQQISRGKASRSTFKGQSLRTDWLTGWLMTGFCLLLVVGLGAVVYQFVLVDFFAQLQALTDSLPMQFVSAVTR